jgi:hypothetical protein
MQHKTLQELQRVAAVHPDRERRPMTRNERLERWAELLERDPGATLSTLSGTEYQSGEARETMRSNRSPISVAFDDPVLRAEGLTGDSYGDAKRFFELTDWQLHDVLCHCHYGASMTAAVAARRVRGAIRGEGHPGLFSRLREAVAW